MGFIKTILIIVLILLVFTFFPKYSGGGAICFGCDSMECSCFGKEGTLKIVAYEQDLCLGVPYDCNEISPAKEDVGRRLD